MMSTHIFNIMSIGMYSVLYRVRQKELPDFGVAYLVGKRVQWCGARLRTSVYVPFSGYTMAWSGEHRAFIVEEFIRNGGSPVATQRAFRGDIGWPPPPPDLTPCDFFLLGYTKQRFTNNIP